MNQPETETENQSDRTQKISLAAQVVVNLLSHFCYFCLLILLI